jgi:hypothetical protein
VIFEEGPSRMAFEITRTQAEGAHQLEHTTLGPPCFWVWLLMKGMLILSCALWWL